MRVLHLLLGNRIWGVEQYVLTLHRVLQAHGIDCIVVCRQASLCELLQAKGVDCHLVPIAGYWDFSAVHNISALATKLKVDLIHTHLGLDSFIGTMAANCARVPCVSSVHFDKPTYARFPLVVREMWRCVQILKNLAISHFFPITERVGDELGKRELVPRHKMTVVSPGSSVRATISDADRKAIRQKHGITDDRVLVLSIGRLESEKGMDVLVAAAKKVIAARHEVEFWIVGDGSQRSKLEPLVGGAYRAGIKLLGYRDDTNELLEACDLFVLASREEPFGMVAVEAMMCERPVVATRGTGLATIVAPKETGSLVAPGDPEELAAAILALLKDPQLMRRYGEAGRARAIENFTEETMARKISAVYRNIFEN